MKKIIGIISGIILICLGIMEKNYLKKTPIKKDKHKWIENLNEYGRLRRLYFSDALIIIGIGIIWWAWNDVF